MTLDEVASAGERIVDKVPDTGRVIWGARVGSSLTGRVRVMAVLIGSLALLLKESHFFVNEKGEQLSLQWFNERINHYAKIIGIQKIKRYYADGRILKLVTCMALRGKGSVTTIMPVEAGNYWQ